MSSLGQQRLLLKRILSSHFKQKVQSSGSIRSSITVNNHMSVASDRLTAIYQDMEEELRITKEEKNSLLQKLSDLEVLLNDEKADNQQLSENWEEAEVRNQKLCIMIYFVSQNTIVNLLYIFFNVSRRFEEG